MPSFEFLVKDSGTRQAFREIWEVVGAGAGSVVVSADSLFSSIINANYKRLTKEWLKTTSGQTSWAIESNDALDYLRVLRSAAGTSKTITWVEQAKFTSAILDLTAHLRFSPDNTKDIGQSVTAKRPRDIYLGGSLFFGADVEVVRGAASRLDVLDALRLTGVLDFATDNTIDLAAAAAGRPRTGYFGTSLVVPTIGPVAAQQHTLPAVASDTIALLLATQSMSNKTLITPTIASFVNATHTHQNAAGGGTLDHGLALVGLGDDDHTQYALRSIMTTLGDIIYAGAAAVWTRLAGNITTTRKFMRQTGDGAASAAPAWDTIVAADIAEILALADLSDVTAKTGTGTTVVMDTSPTVVTPTVASFVNANHNHQDAAGGGVLNAADLSNQTRTRFIPSGGISGTAALGQLGGYQVVLLESAGNGVAYHTFLVPDDFVSFTSLQLVYASEGGTDGQDWRVSVSANYGGKNEPWNNYALAAVDQTIDVPVASSNNRIYVEATNEPLTGLAVGDYVGVGVTRLGAHVDDTYSVSIRFFGLLFTYVANH